MTEGPRSASRNRAARCWLPAVAFTLLLQAACSQTQPPPLPATDLLLLVSADIPGLEETGYLRDGYSTDAMVFDPDRFAPMADYVPPRELSRGVEYLLVNGRPAIAEGKLTGIAAGRVASTHPRPAPVHDASAPTGAGRIHFGKTLMIEFT